MYYIKSSAIAFFLPWLNLTKNEETEKKKQNIIL